MSTQKKRAKKYRPKPCVLPLGIRRAHKLELPGYAASLALGQSWFCEQHVYDLLSSADLAKRTAPDGHPVRETAQAMIFACAEIQQRTQRTGKLGVTGDEMKVLREGVGRTIDWLRTVPNVAIARASAEAIAEFNRTGVLRV